MYERFSARSLVMQRTSRVKLIIPQCLVFYCVFSPLQQCAACISSGNKGVPNIYCIATLKKVCLDITISNNKCVAKLNKFILYVDIY